MSPTSKRAAIRHATNTYKLSERRSCSLVGLSKTGYRYQSKSKADNALRTRLRELAAKYLRYGYLMLHELIKQEGLVINLKRTYRLCTEEKLQVRTKKRKKLIRPRQSKVMPIAEDIRWSMDFVSDQLVNGRRLRVLNIVDY